jgi:hypothetical protein
MMGQRNPNVSKLAGSCIVSAVALLAVVSLLAPAPASAPGQNNAKGRATTSDCIEISPRAHRAGGKLADETPDLSAVWLGSEEARPKVSAGKRELKDC